MWVSALERYIVSWWLYIVNLTYLVTSTINHEGYIIYICHHIPLLGFRTSRTEGMYQHLDEKYELIVRISKQLSVLSCCLFPSNYALLECFSWYVQISYQIFQSRVYNLDKKNYNQQDKSFHNCCQQLTSLCLLSWNVHTRLHGPTT